MLFAQELVEQAPFFMRQVAINLICTYRVFCKRPDANRAFIRRPCGFRIETD